MRCSEYGSQLCDTVLSMGHNCYSPLLISLLLYTHSREAGLVLSTRSREIPCVWWQMMKLKSEAEMRCLRTAEKQKHFSSWFHSPGLAEAWWHFLCLNPSNNLFFYSSQLKWCWWGGGWGWGVDICFPLEANKFLNSLRNICQSNLLIHTARSSQFHIRRFMFESPNFCWLIATLRKLFNLSGSSFCHL